MKIFWLNISFKQSEPAKQAKIFKGGGSIGMTWELPDTTMDLFFQHYAKNSDIRGCIKELQETVGKWGRYLSKKWTDEAIKEDSPQYKSIWILLNNHQSFDAMKRRIIRDISVTGNAYILKLKNASWELLGWQVIDPRTMRIVSTAYGEVIKYIQVVNGVATDFWPDEIIHRKDETDPDNEIFGLSILESVIYEVLADSEASMTNYYYFKNNAIPSTIIQLEDGMTEDQQEIAIEMLKKSFSWAKNKHKIGAVSWIKGFQKLQDGMKDMEFMNMRMFTTQRVCAAFGVPKVILNYTDWVNYTNADMQYTKYIDNTIRPREWKICDIMTKLIADYDDTVEFCFHDAHINDIKEKTTVQTQQLAFGLKTLNEIRQENGDDEYTDVPEANAPLMTRTLAPLEMSGLDSMPVTIWE